MSLFEQLPQADKEKLKLYIENYGTTHYQPLGNTLEHILRFWNKEKADLFKAFGEKFIVSDFIETSLSPTAITHLIENKIVYAGYPNKAYLFIDNFKSRIPYGAIDDHTEDNGSYYNLVSPSALAKNRLEKDLDITLANGKHYRVNKDSKIAKVIAKVADSYGIEGYEDFRLAHSLCLNEKRVAGNLCFSIHPLDYLTMSDNDCSWTSCMRLRANYDDDEDDDYDTHLYQGEYSQGPVEMMNSPCVVVAYLDSKTPMNIWDRCGEEVVQWSNKKWRCLFIVNKDIIIPVKQYPYENEHLERECLDRLKTLIEANTDWRYTDTPHLINDRTRFREGSCFYDIDYHFSTDKMYCDFPERINRLTYISKDHPYGEFICLNYSGETECIICGMTDEDYKEPIDALEHWQPCCIGCSGYVVCADCEETISLDYAEWDPITERWYCESCYTCLLKQCRGCGESHHYRHLREVVIEHKFPELATSWHNGHINYWYFDLCDKCVNDKEIQEIFGNSIIKVDDDCYSVDAEVLADLYHKGKKEWVDLIDIKEEFLHSMLKDFPPKDGAGDS